MGKTTIENKYNLKEITNQMQQIQKEELKLERMLYVAKKCGLFSKNSDIQKALDERNVAGKKFDLANIEFMVLINKLQKYIEK